jgi:hypothetical protein
MHLKTILQKEPKSMVETEKELKKMLKYNKERRA